LPISTALQQQPPPAFGQQQNPSPPPNEVLGNLSEEEMRAILLSNPELLRSFAAARGL
jgi:hypothetical protein